MRAIEVLAPLVIASAGAGLAHFGQTRADAQRHEVAVDMDVMFLPDGPTLRVASMGYQEVVADLLWIRTALLFGERWGQGSTAAWEPWIKGMIRAITTLDPTWRTPYYYGGMFLRVLEDVDGSDEIFMAGAEAFPQDSFFPFAVGMNAYLLRNDAESAAKWVVEASNRPGAPAWYKAAAAGFLANRDQRVTAIRFLQEERNTTTDPDVREALDSKLAELTHDEFAERLEQLAADWKVRNGRDVTDPSELGITLPPDPLEGTWIVAPDGRIRSSVREKRETLDAQARERAWLKR